MKVLLALILGVLIGAAAFWFLGSERGRTQLRSTTGQIESGARTTRDAVQEELRRLRLSPDEVREELARSGQVLRRKTQEAGQTLSDATADARVTAAIKGKLLASKNLSALQITVDTTQGRVTLAGSVNSMEDISKALLLAMQTEGVREVVSTLQVKTKPATPGPAPQKP